MCSNQRTVARHSARCRRACAAHAWSAGTRCSAARAQYVGPPSDSPSGVCPYPPSYVWDLYYHYYTHIGHREEDREKKGEHAPDNVGCRIVRGGGRCRTSRRATRTRQKRNTSCANRRRPLRESSRIWRRHRPNVSSELAIMVIEEGKENAPSVRILARADHTLERGAIQQ